MASTVSTNKQRDNAGEFPMFEKNPADYSEYSANTTPMVWVKRGVLGVAVVAFGGLIWYAAASREHLEQNNLNPPVVEAPQGPVKERAAEPGGMQVPYRDQQVFDLLKNQDKNVQPPRPEDLTQAQEDGTAAPKVMPQPAQQVQQNAAQQAQKAEDVLQSAHTAPAAQAVAPQATAVQPAPQAVAPVVAPKPAAPAAAVVQKTAPAPTPVTPAPKAATATTGNWGVQVGSYRSQAAAENGAKIIIKKNSSLLSGMAMTVHKVDLSKGTFYRVIFGGISKDAASTLCKQLEAHGQACLRVTM